MMGARPGVATFGSLRPYPKRVMGFLIKLCLYQDSQGAHGTSGTQTATVQDVSVDQRRSRILVSEELLHSTDSGSPQPEDS